MIARDVPRVVRVLSKVAVTHQQIPYRLSVACQAAGLD